MKRKLLFLAVLAVWLSGCGYLPSPAPQTADWKTYAFDEFHLSIDSPYPFTRDLSSQLASLKMVKSMMKQTPMSPGEKGDLFTVTVTSGKVDHAIPVSADEMAKGSLEYFSKNSVLFSDVKSQSKAVTCSGMPADYSFGTYKMYHISPTRFVILTTLKGHWYWQVNIQYAGKGDDAEKMAQRVIQSMQVKVEDLDKEK